MDLDGDSKSDTSTDSVLLELAAHPLSSINPPPRDLPDLLDSVISSESRIKEKMRLCDEMTGDLVKQAGLIRYRSDDLAKANPQFEDNTKFSVMAGKDKGFMIHRSHAFLLRHMVWQLAFLVSKFGGDFKEHLERLTTAHGHLFKEFLGQRHDHPGIEIADSQDITCSNGCGWYFHNGPYEWTKRPYTNEWWKEMNGTDWDWIRVREHIKNTIAESRKAIMNLDMFYGNVEKFLPAWVWYDNLKTWEVKGEIETVEGADGEMKEEVKLKIRFIKTDEVKNNERIATEKRQRQQWIQEGMNQNEAATKPVDIEIKSIGIQPMDEKVVFDGEAVAPNWNNGGKHYKVGSWLNWWGFRQWLDDSKAEQTKKAAMSSGHTAQMNGRNASEQTPGNTNAVLSRYRKYTKETEER